jgi:rfaE bifunctional protein kinase chain/domain
MYKELQEIIKKFLNKKVIVWGDLILDEYIYTTTGRISREAPVLVTEFESNEFKLGGAGNVVLNIKSLGAEPIPVGFIGDDLDGKILKEILNKSGIKLDYLIETKDYKTPKKSRILSGGESTKKQQVLRIDKLNRSEIKDTLYNKIEKNLLDLLENVDLLIISDYIYESVKPDILNNIKRYFPSKLITIDSRNNLLKFHNTYMATPNEPEVKKMFPDNNFYSEKDFFKAGLELLEKIKAEGIILKRGHNGLIVFEKNKKPRIINIHGSSDIVDVTGAGDTVISVISLSLLSKVNLFLSAQLANIAAGIVVMKEGAYPINYKELYNELK